MESSEKRSIIAGLYGNALEWYDFLLYASFAPLFAEIFFPTDAPFLSMIATFTVFAIGFLVRPIGGALLGHYADHVGRRKALIVSVTIMTITTTFIAFLPTYQYAGIIAPILFTLFRLVQGIAIGGELPGSATFLIEHMFNYGRGFAGSLVLCTAFLGIFAGSLTASLLSAAIPYEQLAEWGWRLAYCIGGALGILGIYLRFKSVEPSTFLQEQPSEELPAKLVFTRYKKQLLLAVICTSILAVGNYMLIAYATSFLVKSASFSLNDALLINFISLFLLTLLIPVMGLLSDYLGRKVVFLSGIIGIFLLAFPIFWLLMSGSWWYALGSELLLGIVLSPINATVPTIIAEMFPTMVRASGTSIGYNIGQALFGGTAPLIAILLIEMTGNNYAPAWYMFIWTIIVILAARFLQETNQKAPPKNPQVTEAPPLFE
ncbi:MFS transporter [Legionella nagasakiensis]|uniref:MFS transporter n=1 Tax=Legionella nagasakiensis TaxID=535290 RepID=UPI0010543F4E|nr:MFS transporter [Legionella nagasakiensis]